MFSIFYIVLFILFDESTSVIYNLNGPEKALINVKATTGSENNPVIEKNRQQNRTDTEYARMPALFGLDEYDLCLTENQGIYCVLKLDLIDDPDNDLMKLIKEYSKEKLKHYNHSYIERGVCVKKTCSEFIKDHTLNDSADLTYILDECLNATIFRSYKVQSKVSQVYYCNRQGVKSEINLLDWCVAGVFFAIVLINLIGSLYDYVVNNNREETDQGNKFLLSFSIRRNWEWLVNYKFEDGKLRRLKGFYGIRTIINLLTIYGHTLSLIGAGFTDRPHSLEKTFNSSLYVLLYNGTMVVQTFFVMSGFLLTYNFLIRTESSKSKTTWTTIPMAVFLRWWRLTPALVMLIAFTMTWLRHLGSGPLWNFYVTSSVVHTCQKYWWSHIFYFNNFIPDNKYCAIHTWYIASDFQLSLIGLIVLVATTSKGRGVVLSLLLVLSLFLPAFHVWLHNLEAIAFLTPEFFRRYGSDTFYYLHIYGHNNLSSYTIGMITAILIHKWQNKAIDLSGNKLYTALLWLVIPGIVGVIYSASLVYIAQERASLVVRMLYAATHRCVLSLIIASGVIGSIMKFRTILRKIFEWRGWVVPSRLTYSVYLIHLNFIYILLGVRYTMIPVSFWFLHIYFFGIATLSYLLSVPFFLMIEAPLNSMMKNITSTRGKSINNNKE